MRWLKCSNGRHGLVGPGSFWPGLTTALAQEKTQTKTKAGAKTVEGELVSLDVKKLSAVVKTDDGTRTTVTLGKDIKVVGPRGGARKDGLDDDDLDPGAKVSFTIAANNKTATQLKILAAAPAAATRASAREDDHGKTTTEIQVDYLSQGHFKTTKSTTRTTTDVKGPAGKIVKVDVDAKTFTIQDDSGEVRLHLRQRAQFIGPRGGQGRQERQDDRFRRRPFI